MTNHVFVGYDPREHDAWLVCKRTLEYYEGARQDVNVYPLNHRTLRQAGLFSRPWTVDEKGQFHDIRDGKPFSTDFSHSRFIVPHLAKEAGLTGWVMFVDCDFLFRSPVSFLFGFASDHPEKAVLCVKHKMHVEDNAIKMDGVVNQAYHRKMWSSLMMINLDHPANDHLEMQDVSYSAGSWLHGLSWLHDDQIGSLSSSWNWIPGHSAGPDKYVNAVHFSLGGPWMSGFEDVEFAQEWRMAFRDVLFSMTRSPVNKDYMNEWIGRGLEHELETAKG